MISDELDACMKEFVYPRSADVVSDTLLQRKSMIKLVNISYV